MEQNYSHLQQIYLIIDIGILRL